MNKFWEKVDKTDPSGCWIWTGARSSAGYGQIRIQHRLYYAHRLMWIIMRGVIPYGLEILHKCDNPWCVNPDHLFIGSQSDNIIDSVSKGRFNRPWGENHPKAKLTVEQVHEIRYLYAPRVGRYDRRMSQRKLARLYGVSRSAIDNILKGRNWKKLGKEVTNE